MKSNATLKTVLDEKKAQFELKANNEIKKIYGEGIDAVLNSGILSTALNIGDKAPDFTLENAVGDPVKLSEYLKDGPVVLTWYRGGWCPYCNLTLNHLQANLSEIKAESANLLAITSEIPDKSLSTVEKNNLEFEVLSDVENEVGNKFGIIFELTSEVADVYEKSFQFHEYYGNDRKELPLAATYVIDQSGIIRYAFLDSDYRNRAEPSEIVDALRNIEN